MTKEQIADRLRAAGFTPTDDQIDTAHRAFASTRETYLRLREENPVLAAEFARANPASYEREVTK